MMEFDIYFGLNIYLQFLGFIWDLFGICWLWDLFESFLRLMGFIWKVHSIYFLIIIVIKLEQTVPKMYTNFKCI